MKVSLSEGSERVIITKGSTAKYPSVSRPYVLTYSQSILVKGVNPFETGFETFRTAMQFTISQFSESPKYSGLEHILIPIRLRTLWKRFDSN